MSAQTRLHLYHLHLLLLHLGAAAALYDGDSQWLINSVLIYLFLQIIGGNIALHRYFSHDSFTTGAWREKFLIVVGNLTCLGSSIAWVSTHKHHHRHADQAEDCHSPQHLSVRHILWGYWNPPDNVAQALRPLRFFKWHLFFHRWYYLLHFGLMAVLLLINWKLFAYYYALPNLLVYYALYAVVILCHRFGSRRFATPDESRNNLLVALFTMGEGWHNNHHQSPKNHRNSIGRGELDISALVIEIFFKI